MVAGSGVEMERDYEFSSCVYGEDLDPPAEIGRRAAERTVRRLGARKATTGQVPVVFDPRVSGSLLGHLSRAINGTEVARGTSFLKDQMEQQIFAKGIVVVDDPHRARGLRSRPFDDEGLINRRCLVVSDGRLATWLLDLASARQLNLTSTGHASRSTAGTPHPASSNLYLEPGSQTPAALIGDIEAGFYVTEMMGMGVNGVTGDYSRGAAGFWIDRGELAYPVSEVTVAGNLKDMFPKLTPADDLEFRYATNAPHRSGRRHDRRRRVARRFRRELEGAAQLSAGAAHDRISARLVVLEAALREVHGAIALSFAGQLGSRAGLVVGTADQRHGRHECCQEPHRKDIHPCLRLPTRCGPWSVTCAYRWCWSKSLAIN